MITVPIIIRKGKHSIEIDVVLLNFKVINPSGNLKLESKDGENIWMKIEEIKAIQEKEKLIGFNERLDFYLKNQINLQEFIS